MDYANNESNYTECALCDHDTKCFFQYEYGVEHAMCPECLRTTGRNANRD